MCITRRLAGLVTLAALLGGTAARADELDENLKQIRGIGGEFARASSNFMSDAGMTAELAARFDQTGAWLHVLLQKHQSEIDAGTSGGRALRTAANYLTTEMRRFRLLTKEFASQFAKDFDVLVQIAEKQAEDALRSKSPGFFEAARESLIRAGDMVKILSGLNGTGDETVQKALRRVEELRVGFADKEVELRALAIEQVRAPENVYDGADKEALRRLVVQAWGREYPRDAVIEVLLPGSRWDRTPRAHWNDATSAWTFSETSTLPARVIVRKDSRRATIYVAQIAKDSTTDGLVVNVKTKSTEFPVQDVLADRVK